MKNSERNWCVYLLVCKGNRLYIGVTNNLHKRLEAHEIGKGSKFVRAFNPCSLIGTIKDLDKVEAMKMEYKLKKLTHKEKREAFTFIK